MVTSNHGIASLHLVPYTYNLCLCVPCLLPDLVSLTSGSVDSSYQTPLGGPSISLLTVSYA